MEQIDLLKLRIPNKFDNEEKYTNTLEALLEDTKNIALSNLYPFEDWSEMELPKKYYNWQIRASVELFHFLGYEGIKSYSENGLSFSRMEDGISSDLLDELIPKAGKLKRTEEEGETKWYLETFLKTGINLVILQE